MSIDQRTVAQNSGALLSIYEKALRRKYEWVKI